MSTCIINRRCLKWYFFGVHILFFLLSSCSSDTGIDIETESNHIVHVPIEINNAEISWTRSIEHQPNTTNRVLLLPFKKNDENIINNESDNYSPDFSAAREVEIGAAISSFSKLNLLSGHTYKIIAIGYNQTDYNFADMHNPNNRFSIESTVSPATLLSTYLLSQSATSVPELFFGTGNALNGDTLKGEYFKPEQITRVKATLTRVVSGLNIEIKDIPQDISSITLVAEKLVKGVFLPELSSASIIAAEDADLLKTLSTQSPQGGSVSFNHYLLPTFDLNRCQLYLDVSYNNYTDRYTVKVPDVSGISLANRLIFSPNQVIKISGSFSQMNIGFNISYGINLEDDVWDGIQQ